MSGRDDGAPAFPHHDAGDTSTRPGMTLRDYFAAKAMEGYIASYAGESADPFDPRHIGRTAHRCYAMADAMLEARQR